MTMTLFFNRYIRLRYLVLAILLYAIAPLALCHRAKTAEELTMTYDYEEPGTLVCGTIDHGCAGGLTSAGQRSLKESNELSKTYKSKTAEEANEEQAKYLRDFDEYQKKWKVSEAVY